MQPEQRDPKLRDGVLTDAPDIQACDDVDVLWRTLQAARRDLDPPDDELVRAVERRMRELRGERRFDHLDDAELERRIAALGGQRGTPGVLAYSPGGGGGGGEGGAEDTLRFNAGIREGAHVGLEETLAALVEERDRRRG